MKKYLDKYIKKKIKILEINELDIYRGIITNILEDSVIIDFGYKAEGIIPLNEFKKEKIKIGDKKDIIIIKLYNNGNFILSYKKAKKYKNWKKIQNDYNKQKILKGYIVSRTKGGFLINLYKNFSCFLPGSQANMKIIKNYNFYIGRKIEVQILKINLKTKNIIVSHKILIEKKIKQKKEKIISKLEIGQIIQGKIKNIISYGAFVDLGGIDGLLHITDIMWKKKKNPFQDLKVGSEYKFLILGIDKKQLRIQLGLKQLEINPWDLLKKKIKIGSIIKGRINTITDYGAFVNIKYGIEGLLHISEVYWEESKLKDVKKIIKINKIVKCLIYNIDKHDKKIYLSIKRLTKDPWESLVKKYEVDSIYEGKVNKIFRNNYGLKIELEKNLFGILLNYDISWYYNIVNLYSKYKIGDKIKIKILSIDKKKKKIYLGHKQLKPNNWIVYKKKYRKYSIHTVEIIKININGVILKNKEDKDLIFFIPYIYLKNIKYKIKDKIKISILEVNEKLKKILSIPYKKRENKNTKFTFGDLDELNKIKKKLEKEENKNKI